MTGEYLIEEAKRLERPCFYLQEDGNSDQLAAVWGGVGLVVPDLSGYDPEDVEEWQTQAHVITVDCRFLPSYIKGLTGCFSVYNEDIDGGQNTIYHNNLEMLTREKLNGGVGLKAVKAMSQPDIDAVFSLGSPEIHQWLREKGWQPDWGYNDNFKDGKPVSFFEKHYFSSHPFFDHGATIYAMLGGYPMSLPGHMWDEYEQKGEQLVLFTFRDAEPWYEVWWDGAKLRLNPEFT